MASLLSPPFISIDGIHNFRCIGKYPTSNPTSITRSDLLFRSAEPSHVTPSGIEGLKGLKITTIFDLRSLPEINRMRAYTPIVEIDGIERVFVPVFKDNRDYSPEAIALRYKDYTSVDGTEGFRRAYEDILENGSGSYRRIFEHIRDKPKEGCLVHCTAGKDRTGLLVALVLQLVGVEDEIIAEEYGLTEVGLAAWKEAIIKNLLLWEVGLGDVGREGAERMLGARPANMLATLDMIKNKFDGAEGYLKQKCGFEDQDIERIRMNIIESRQTAKALTSSKSPLAKFPRNQRSEDGGW